MPFHPVLRGAPVNAYNSWYAHTKYKYIAGTASTGDFDPRGICYLRKQSVIDGPYVLYRDAQCGSFCVKGGKVQLRLRWCMITAGGKYVVSTSSVYLRVFYGHPYPTSTEYRWVRGETCCQKKKMLSMCEMLSSPAWARAEQEQVRTSQPSVVVNSPCTPAVDTLIHHRLLGTRR